jgi:hypothetical protein
MPGQKPQIILKKNSEPKISADGMEEPILSRHKMVSVAAGNLTR